MVRERGMDVGRVRRFYEELLDSAKRLREDLPVANM
jgi:hypothetical protein